MAQFLWVGCYPTNNVKALIHPGFILSSSTNGILTEGSLLPLRLSPRPKRIEYIDFGLLSSLF